jgi:hypothetical protein
MIQGIIASSIQVGKTTVTIYPDSPPYNITGTGTPNYLDFYMHATSIVDTDVTFDLTLVGNNTGTFYEEYIMVTGNNSEHFTVSIGNNTVINSITVTSVNPTSSATQIYTF